MSFFGSYGSDSSAYTKAYRKGRDEMNQLEKQGKYPYLRDLDSKIANVNIVSELSIGMIEVPLRQIVGTYTRMRSASFSKGFMPILKPGSEFHSKWERVYNIQVTEGLRDAIKAYEYLNQIYVIEGNKRISVMKYCDIYSYHANITRLLPKKDPANPKSLIYYASLDFYKLAGYNGVWFSKPDKYDKLVSIIDKHKDALSVENPYRYVATSIYENFRQLYIQYGGKPLPITTADAFLYFINLNGLAEPSYTDIYKTMVQRYVHTLSAITSDDMDQYVEVDTPTRTSVVAPRPARLVPLKVGFIYPDNAADSWGAGHKKGQNYISEKYLNSLITQSYSNVSTREEDYDTIHSIVEENDIVFATSPLYYRGMLRASLQHTTKDLFLCSSFSMFEYVKTYFGRCYEPAFVLGAVAASLSCNDNILFVCPQLLPSSIMSLNAFTQGAKLINPKANIFSLSKTILYETDEAYNRLIQTSIQHLECDVSYSTSFFNESQNMFKKMGLYRHTKGEWIRIAKPVWHWSRFYENIIDDLLSHRFKPLIHLLPSKNKRLNYWWGLDSGLIEVMPSHHLTHDTIKLIQFMQDSLKSKVVAPFSGPIYDRFGTMQIQENDAAALGEIVNMNWLASGIKSNINDEELRKQFDEFNSGLIEE